LSLLIHIIQNDDEMDTVESITIPVSSITELRFVHPAKQKDQIESEEFIDNTSEMEVMYNNGEIKTLTTAQPTVFRLLDSTGVLLSTDNARVFEATYIDKRVLMSGAEAATKADFNKTKSVPTS